MNRALLKTNAKRQLGGSLFANNWLNGLLICLIYSAVPGAISGIASSVSSFRYMFNMQDFINAASTMDLPNEFSFEAILKIYQTVFSFMGPTYVVVVGVTALVSIFLIYPLEFGMQKSFLDLVMGGDNLKIDTLFSGFKRYGETVLLGFMRSLLLWLWSLLFIIPGIIKYYAYQMAYYVMADHPDYTWRQCLKESERLMKGYKFSFFVLQFSFIGWSIVGMMVCGIGALWVVPYAQCTYANFYAWRTAELNPAAPAPAPEEAYGYAPAEEPAAVPVEEPAPVPVEEPVPAEEPAEVPAEEPATGLDTEDLPETYTFE